MSSATEDGSRRPVGRALFVLSSAYFFIGTTSLSVVGLVVEMGEDLSVSTSSIAALMTIFAIVYAVAAPGLQAFLGGFARRNLIACGLLLVAISCFVCAASSTYAVVALSRVGMAVGAALTGPSASAAAAALVPAERRVQALAAVFAGFTIATVLGIPTASFLGQTIGWRWAWALIGAAALCVTPFVFFVLPQSNRGKPATLRILLGVLRDRAIALSVSTTALQVAGPFTTYALLAAWFVEHLGVPRTYVPPALLLFGLVGVAGNALASVVEPRLGAERTVQICLVLMGAALLCMWLFPPWPLLVLIPVLTWSATGLMIMAPLQGRLVQLSPDRANLTLALNASAVYVGMSIGSALAAIVYAAAGIGSLPLVSVLVVGLAWITFRLSLVR